MAEENASANEPMRLLAGESLDLLPQLIIHTRAAKSIHELVVVNACIFGSLDQERGHLILVLFFGSGRLKEGIGRFHLLLLSGSFLRGLH